MTPKFKAITTDGKWVESMTIAKGKIKRKERNLYMEIEPDNWKQVIPETVCQFTGITDKNGKEIYQGDLVKYDYYLDKGQSGRHVSKNAEEVKFSLTHGCSSFLYDSDSSNLEITGNIFDHLVKQ